MDNQPPAVPESEDDIDARDRGLGRVSLRDMRRFGLRYLGGGHVPGVPAQTMTGDEATVAVPDRAALLGLLSTGYYAVADPPPEAPAPGPRARPQPAAAPQEDEVNHAG